MPTSYKPLKIAFFDHTVLLSGGEQSLLQLLKGLDRSLYDPLLIVPAAGAFPSAVKALGIPVLFLPFPSYLAKASRKMSFLFLPFYLWGLWQMVRRLRSICKNHGVHVLHSNSLKTHVIGSFLNLPNVKRVWHMRDILKVGATRWGFNLLARWAPVKIICISQSVAKQFGGLAKVVVVHNAVEFNHAEVSKKSQALLKQIQRMKKTTAPQKLWVLACVGQIAYWKGQDIFIEAIRLLKQRGFSVLGLLVGEVLFPEREQKFKNKLQRLVKAYQLTESVVFVGQQNPVKPWFEISDMLVHCNREPEPFGRVLVEAMLAKKVVISPARLVTQEVLPSALMRLQVPSEDPRALADQIEKLLLRPEQLSKVSNSLKPWAEKKFSNQKMIDAVHRIYEEVVR